MNKRSEDKWWQDNFPTKQARDKADLVIDKLDVKESMQTYIDVWISAYKASGGKTDLI